jgi:hypothetical protein
MEYDQTGGLLQFLGDMLGPIRVAAALNATKRAGARNLDSQNRR